MLCLAHGMGTSFYPPKVHYIADCSFVAKKLQVGREAMRSNVCVFCLCQNSRHLVSSL